MTTAVSLHPESATRDAVGFALGLALGTPTRFERRGDWAQVFDAASRELLAPLAWARSGRVIRAHATPSIAGAWRRSAIAAHLRGQQQLALLRSATAALHAAGVDAVVLKGLPLGEALYGDPFVRCCADIDLHVPARQRDQASGALEAIGWRRVDGCAPWHETWSLWQDDAVHHLELHSTLVSDHLAHLPVPPPSTAAMCVAGEVVRVHTGPFVAPYLAAHLATHQMAPLLWLVDFATLWGGLSVVTRLEAERVAREAGLDRYLDWARGRGALLDRASDGDAVALERLGIGEAGRRDGHSIWRHLSLASSLGDRIRVLGAFIAPRPARRDVGTLARYTVARVRTRLGSLFGASRLYGATSGRSTNGTALDDTTLGRPLQVERADMVALTGDVIRAGGALWIRAPGGSMLPTIPRGALVRVEPLPDAGVSKGDVVLALTSDGEPFIHRVVGASRGVIATRGDGAIHGDAPVPLSSVIGIATAVRDGEGERPLGRRARRSVATTVLKLRRRVARVVRRAR